MEQLNDKDLVMKQNEFGDYEGYCPHCGEIFYIPLGAKVSPTNPVWQCRFCGEWVRLF